MSREIITVAQMRAIDTASARAGVSTRNLMENAGRAVAEAIVARFTPRPTAVLCGPGANGGDGWVAARALQERGWPVWVESLAARDELSGDAADAAAAWRGETMALGARADTAELVVDALFGAGLSRPLEGEAARLAEAIPPERVVAIDAPSGLEGDSGSPLGDAYFRAALTVTFVRKKPAHVLAPGRALCGEVIVADIGAPDNVVAAQSIALWENDPALWSLPWPEMDAYKHQRGHVMAASGGRARTGAARLAARAALRAGAGLVTVLSPGEALDENAAQLTAIMLRETGEASAYAEAARTAQCLVIGPAFGTSDAHYELLLAAIDSEPRGPIVFDADAITLLAPITHGFDSGDVLTPHVGEFRRAFPGIWSNTESRIDAARAAAAYARCNVLLKGPDTVIAAPDGRAVVNTTGTAFLATAGAGDVLAGVIAGLIGQGMGSFEAACAAAWLHGRAAEQLGPGLIAEDLCEQLPVVLNSLAPARLRARPAG
ncbi:MAG TPA: NAD(P)H-hydrate dehydratase [Vitreimonas sp.]|uniref:NAD(P)H-hydrate dehydratase n=1 Tax=Vitreimonas sp. TaxID=3069702 RepID=UPI002D5CE3FC|nr:NAD(P)H-hydrate dehydratase [Vitreimonas sp.]HYD87421.1 NAD(P)H-hydrate dehydratase [Vitreimonas sp.]